MEIIIAMAQRKCRYQDEYGPECLSCMSEYEHSDNPEYIENVIKKYRNTGEFESVEIIRLDVDEKEIKAVLFPDRLPIKAHVKPISKDQEGIKSPFKSDTLQARDTYWDDSP